MGSKLVENYRHEGFKSLLVYDLNEQAVNATLAPGVKPATIQDMANKCDAIISILPNDEVLSKVTNELLSSSNSGNKFVHISCSTVSPTTSRSLEGMIVIITIISIIISIIVSIIIISIVMVIVIVIVIVNGIIIIIIMVMVIISDIILS